MAWPCWKCVLVYIHTPPTVVFVVYCCVFLLFVGLFGSQPGAGTRPGIFLSLHSALFVPLFSLLITQSSLVHCPRKVQSIQQDSAPCCRWFRHVGNTEFESAPKVSLFVLKKPRWRGGVVWLGRWGTLGGFGSDGDICDIDPCVKFQSSRCQLKGRERQCFHGMRLVTVH